jgi:excisionase family DNA binding protein
MDDADAETPLFVRLPPKIAARLDRAAFELRLSKKELVTALLSRHMDDDVPDGPDRLRQIHDEVEHFRVSAGLPHRKRTFVLFDRDTDGPGMDAEPGRSPAHPGVGNATFRTFDAPEVLSIEDAAELLQVPPDDVQALAVAGEIPGRKIGETWRFSRAAVLRWLEHEPGA